MKCFDKNDDSDSLDSDELLLTDSDEEESKSDKD